ncbi:MAG TPA: LysM peptidoglycan-binding domain-containing protein [Smithellaceae bacterium]|nr:LysM peptidoglycan-binding domain-containing protein [Smithellaceae bacterium]
MYSKVPIITLVKFFVVLFLIAGCAGGESLKGAPHEQKQQLPAVSMETQKQEPVKESPASAGSLAKEKSVTVSVAEPRQNTDTETQEEADEECQDLTEKALAMIEEADESWKRGDIEVAIETLDAAYRLVLDTNGDTESARQKDDLRLLIARRLLAIYSSSQTISVNGTASEIPHLLNADVQKEIRSFQGPEREFFIASYQRSWQYREMIMAELNKAGLPEELFWLPLVESGFKVVALSRARALGLWQFIPSTGYKFGLTRDEWVDERMDILKSTQAAIAYLKELHAMFGDWLTVLAAYNCGEGRVLRVIARQHINHFDRFWDLYYQLPNETSRYVPRFLATLHIIKDPAKYGFDLNGPFQQPLRYETVSVNKIMKLSDIASMLEISEETMNILNAELRHKTTPDREYLMRIPQGSLEKFNLVYDDIPQIAKPVVRYAQKNFINYRVRPGDTVSTIARKYSVTVRDISIANRLGKNNVIRAGQTIRIPVRGGVAQRRQGAVSNAPAVKASCCAGGKETGTYLVRSGDTLWQISKRFDVSVETLRKMNNLKSDVVQSGVKLKIPCLETGKSSTDGKRNG